MKPSYLRAHFASHLKRRRATRHFLRHLGFEGLRHAPVSKTLPPDLARALQAAATEAPERLLARLHSHPDGLDPRQAARIRRRCAALSSCSSACPASVRCRFRCRRSSTPTRLSTSPSLTS